MAKNGRMRGACPNLEEYRIRSMVQPPSPECERVGWAERRQAQQFISRMMRVFRCMFEK